MPAGSDTTVYVDARKQPDDEATKEKPATPAMAAPALAPAAVSPRPEDAPLPFSKEAMEARGDRPVEKAAAPAERPAERPTLPDFRPAIGRAPRLANVYCGYGHQHVGLTLATATGRLIVRQMEGEEMPEPLKACDPGRFG